MKLFCKLFILIALGCVLSGCGKSIDETISETGGATSSSGSSKSGGETAQTSASGEVNITSQPTIEVTPAKPGEGDYQIITADKFKITVRAASGAEKAELFYQPVTAADRLLKLQTLNGSHVGEIRFETELATPRDFNGALWARVRYASGDVVDTKHLQLVAAPSDVALAAEQRRSNSSSTAAAPPNQTADDNESARSDKKTGGRIVQAALQPGNGNIRLTVNVPAFLLTIWQDNKEIKTFHVGVGRRQYPIPIGARTASQIILNPDWIPPDSQWVRASGLEPYERIPASSDANPLGKIKIPLGDAYLLHEAQGTSDIGNLVSHGCVRVLRNDLFDLTKIIVQARELSISDKEINAARRNTERRVIELGDEKMTVDINYDTMVVEGGVLNIYPDVYEQKTNTIDELRAELENYQIDVSKLDDTVLKKMLDSVTSERKFVIPLVDIAAGKVFEKDRTEPLTPYQAKNGKQKSAKR